MLNIIKKYRLTTNYTITYKENIGNKIININTIDKNDNYENIVKINNFFKKEFLYEKIYKKETNDVITDYSEIICNSEMNNDIDIVAKYLKDMFHNKNIFNDKYHKFEKLCYKIEEKYCLNNYNNNNNNKTENEEIIVLKNENGKYVNVEVSKLRKYFDNIQNIAKNIYKLRMKHDLKLSPEYNQLNLPLHYGKYYENNTNKTLIGYKHKLPCFIVTPIGIINICDDTYIYNNKNHINFNEELNKIYKIKRISDEEYSDTGYGFAYHSPGLSEIENDVEFADNANVIVYDSENLHVLWKSIKPKERFNIKIKERFNIKK